MADFNVAITKTLMKEGGARITQVANDNGGLTKYGIGQVAYPNLDIRNLTEQQAREIYKRDYWDKIGGDQLSDQAVAESIFDFAVNSGVRVASKLAQMAANQMPDGLMGGASIAAINALNAQIFLPLYTLVKVSRYLNICNQDHTQDKFLRGWLNRAMGAV